MHWKSWSAILIVALLVRVGACWWWQQRLPDGARFGFPDSESYWMLGEAIADGAPYQTNPQRKVFRTPGYPLVLAAVMTVTGRRDSVLAVRVTNSFLGVAAVAAVIALTARLFDAPTAMLAGWAAALYPGAIAMSTFVLSEAAFCPLMMLQFLLWTLALQCRTRPMAVMWSLSAGLIAGAATLVRPSWLMFTPLAAASAAVYACWWPKFDVAASGRLPAGAGKSPVAHSAVARHGLIAAGMLVGLVVAMCPWWIRNWRVTGAFVPTTLQVGESLYDGLHPEATGASDMRFVNRFREELAAEDARGGERDALQATFEHRLDRRMRTAAISWALQNPRRTAELAVIKFVRMWNIWPNESSLSGWRFRVIVAAGYLPLLALGLCGVFWFGRAGWPYWLCFFPAIYFSLLHMVFVGSIRYRQPAMLAMIPLAAGAAARWWAQRPRSIR